MTDDPTLTVRAHDLAAPVTRLEVAGEIDRDSRHQLHEAASTALARDRTRLVLDLTGVTFCDSSGLSLFVQLHRDTAARGGWLRLAGAQPVVRSVLRTTNLDQLLAVHGTVEEAATP